MTPEQFREMRVRLVSTLQKPWHEIDAILNDYAPPWPAPEQWQYCGCKKYAFSTRNGKGAITVDGIRHAAEEHCRPAPYSPRPAA